MELPTIDFDKDDMERGSNNWSLTRKQVVEALEEYGSFRAIYGAISHDQDSRFFDSLQDLFDLPKETKRRFCSDTPFDGYVGDLPMSPLYEAMGMSDGLDFREIQNLSHLMWPPNGNPTFCECLHFHTRKMADLNRTIRRMVFEAYGVEKYFESHDKSIENSVRVMKYGAPMSSEAKGVGTVPHYDTDFITILHENGVQGLEVKAKSCDHWITGINSSGSSFIAIAGGSFLGWSNGRIHSPLHRVVTSGFKLRYSIGLFAAEEGLIEAPSELVDGHHPRLFKPFDRIGQLEVAKTRGDYQPQMSLPILLHNP